MPAQQDLIRTLQSITGRRHVLTRDAATRRYRRGYRYGEGRVLAVVRPATLMEMWRVLQICVAAGKIIIMQAANTGLTGGSTPDGAYDRDVVIVNTLRINGIRLLRGGRQVLCFSGATLYKLEDLLKPLGREPHSVIGSSCIGASVVGGVCNNSGGALVQRGPAYTELALYARVNAAGGLELVNDLGLYLGDTAEDILHNLESGRYTDAGAAPAGAASDAEYRHHVRLADAPTPARFNADPRRLHAASGCAGKLAVFAVLLDTFESAGARKMFYIGTNDTADLTRLRRHMLLQPLPLPVSAEYMHGEAYDIAETFGKDIFLAIYYLGTRFLPFFFAAKSRFDALCEKFGMRNAGDRLLQALAALFPRHLPRRMADFRARFSHHLLLDVAAADTAIVRAALEDLFAGGTAAFFECTGSEAKKAQLHRFVAAGAGVRYRALHGDAVEDVLALDIALRRNDAEWFETLPAEIEKDIVARLYYGHFFCHVFHQDYLVRKGADVQAVKKKMLDILSARGAAYPAEHNVGHAYAAPAPLAGFYRGLDPRNVFNPGIGRTSRRADWL